MKNIHKINNNIYITSNKKIKEGDWIFNEEKEPSVLQCIGQGSLRGWKKIILTTDKDLIKVGVQAIDNEFLEWFVMNPNCDEVEVIYGLYNPSGRKVNFEILNQNHSQCVWKYKIIIPKEEPKQEIVKDLGYWKANAEEDYMKVPISVLRYISELENQMCSDEEVFNLCRAFATFVAHKDPSYKKQQEWFEQFKKK